MDLCTKKLGMQIELHRNNVYQGVELLLLVSMLFLLAIPKCLLIFKENFYYTSMYICIYVYHHHSVNCNICVSCWLKNTSGSYKRTTTHASRVYMHNHHACET